MSSNMTKELNLKICTNQKLKSTPKKNLENLGQSKPGQAFKVLKHLRAQPGDPVDNSTITLPEHESLSNEESAERIAENFSLISSTFTPNLSNSVQKIERSRPQS